MLVFVWTNAWGKEVLRASGNVSYPPSSWAVGDAMVGVGADLLTRIFDDLGIRVDSINAGPWKRTLDALRYGSIDVATTLYKTAEREKHMVFTDEPYMDDINVIWVLKGKGFPFQDWPDLLDKRGGAIIGDSYGNRWDDLFHYHLAMERVKTMRANLKKLEEGRIDYIPYGLYPGLIVIRKYGYGDRMEYLSTPLSSNGLYMAFSKQSPFLKYLPQVNEAIARLKTDGTIDRLIRENIDRYLMGVENPPVNDQPGGGHRPLGPDAPAGHQ